MRTCTLSYIDRHSGVQQLKSFSFYSINYVDFDIAKVIHTKLDGGYSTDIVGYRPVCTVEFAPLYDDKEKLFFLLGFLSSNSKEIAYTANLVATTPYPIGTVSGYVSIESTSIDFNHLEDIFFANAFSITFKLIDLQATQAGSALKTLTPKYSGVESEGTYLCNLIDVSSAEIIKHPLEFMASSALEDICFGYNHKITLDFRPFDLTVEGDLIKLEWLMEFILSKNIQINTQNLGINNKTYNVVFKDNEVRFNNVGTDNVVQLSLTFYERSMRYNYETLDTPFILDTDRLGYKVLG